MGSPIWALIGLLPGNKFNLYRDSVTRTRALGLGLGGQGLGLGHQGLGLGLGLGGLDSSPDKETCQSNDGA